MRAYPVDFTASGQLAYDNSDPIEGEQFLLGLSSTGFTSVKVYDGEDNTGPLLLNAGVNETVALAHELWARSGVYVEVAGSGKGTVWLAS